jgi:hypothetical protein
VALATVAEAKVLGTALATSTSKHLSQWRDALARCPSGEVRDALRAAFVAGFMAAEKVTKKQADNRFDYMAKKWAAPETSRKSAYNGRKAGAGRKEKGDGGAHAVSAGMLACWIACALDRIGKAQLTITDSRMVELLGEIATDLHGESPEAKAQAPKAVRKAKGTKTKPESHKTH